MNEVRVAGLLLAAGAGRRMGRPKALVELNRRLLVEAAAEVLREGGCAPVIVVLGASADEVRARAELFGCELVDNPDWAEGMGSSTRVGLDAAARTDADAVLVLPVDVPEVTAAAVRRVAELADPEVLARAEYDGVPGHPVLIGRSHLAGARESAVGDVGARDYLRRHPVRLVPCADIASGLDVDRPEDLRRLRQA
ncbi:MAG TPA: nucleotidyltransferase family protein [Pseudonocardiaceae bacterium]|jgi:nicotine blue oxidoreductase|nr:nucleotidyltransferase family protein [Pseudonocardiaceae bacterium]